MSIDLRYGRGLLGRRGRARRRAFVRVAAGFVGVLVVAVGMLTYSAPAHAAIPPIKLPPDRYLGTFVSSQQLGDPRYVIEFLAQFDSLTPQNELAWDYTEPTQGTSNLSDADRIVAFAVRNGKQIRGHTLVWHSRLPSWVTNLGTVAELRAATNAHINQVMRHYRGKIRSWDVVREAIEEDGGRRSTLFQQRVGDSYIENAFATARQADPTARLCYSDYNIDEWSSAKTQAVYNLVKDLKARGVPIDCVGLQSHFSDWYQVPAGYRTTLLNFAALGVDVEITELEVIGSDATRADNAERVAAACVAVKRCAGITLWGPTLDDRRR